MIFFRLTFGSRRRTRVRYISCVTTVRAKSHYASFLHFGFLSAILCIPLWMSLPATAQSGITQPGVAQSQTQTPLFGPQAFTPAPLDSGFGPLDPSRPSGITPHQIVIRFAAKESQFKRALDNYTYRRTVKMETFDDQGNVDGQYLQVDDIIFSPTGRKYEKVIYAPENTLTRIAMSPADFDDIEHRLPFTLTTEDIGLYRVAYVGKQRIDQVATYVFDVTPRHVEKGRRYFTGRIWVDTRDLQIIVTNGKNIPDDTNPDHEDLSVPFTTYRQQIDGKYWFPVYTKAEGILHFKNCKECLPNDIPLKEIVKYQDYKRFGSDARILYNGLALADGPVQPSTHPGQPDITQAATTGPSRPISTPPPTLKD